MKTTLKRGDVTLVRDSRIVNAADPTEVVTYKAIDAHGVTDIIGTLGVYLGTFTPAGLNALPIEVSEEAARIAYNAFEEMFDAHLEAVHQ